LDRCTRADAHQESDGASEVVDSGGGDMSDGFERICAVFQLDHEAEPRFIPILRSFVAWEWVDSLRRHDPAEVDLLLRQMTHEYAVLVGDEFD
jgi:hypothetical protein